MKYLKMCFELIKLVCIAIFMFFLGLILSNIEYIIEFFDNFYIEIKYTIIYYKNCYKKF